MNIGLDVRMAGNSGIGVTISKLLEHLPQEKLKRMTLFGRPDWVNDTRAQFISIPSNVYSLSQQWTYPRLLGKSKLSLFHMPHFDFPVFYQGPFVVTIHDIIHYLFPSYSTKPFSKHYSSYMISYVSKMSRTIITVSENTKRDLIAHFRTKEKRIKIIYPGVGDIFKPLSLEESRLVLDKYGIKPGYFLYVGNLRKSKNVPGLIRAYKKLQTKHSDCPPLLLIGENFLPEIDAKNMPRGIVHLAGIPSSELPAFYSAAEVFLFPSFYEGFGLPPIEAMACGTPVLVSGVASLPEVCGEAGYYVNPHSEGELMEGMWELMTSPSKRDELRKKGFLNVKRFSWKRFSELTWKLYEESIG